MDIYIYMHRIRLPGDLWLRQADEQGKEAAAKDGGDRGDSGRADSKVDGVEGCQGVKLGVG